jgi:hypothetical protein
VFEPDFLASGGRPHRLEQHSPEDGGRELSEPSNIKVQALCRFDRDLCKAGLAQLVQPLSVFAEKRRRPRDGAAGGSTGRSIQLRQHFVPDAIPRILDIFVRLVLNPSLAARFQIVLEIGIGDLQQRPDDTAAPGIDARQAREPRAAHQLEQERLGLIVLRVTDGDAIRPGLRRCTLQKGVSDAAGRIFDRQAAGARVCLDVGGLHDDWQRTTRGKLATKRFVAVRGRPEAVMEMRQADHAEIAVLGELLQEQGERHGV